MAIAATSRAFPVHVLAYRVECGPCGVLDTAGREAALSDFFRLLWNLDVVAIGLEGAMTAS